MSIPEKIARRMVKGIRRNRFLIYTNGYARLAAVLRALLPTTTVRLTSRLDRGMLAR